MWKDDRMERTWEKRVKEVWTQRKLPEKGWSDLEIDALLSSFAMKDSNNDPNGIGCGEREGRVYSTLVQRRYHHLSHGIGKSGDLYRPQPKAIGSSQLITFTHYLLRDSLKIAGLHKKLHSILFPGATGSCLLFSLLALKRMKPTASKVIWFRIDQQTAPKAILAAGCEWIIIEGKVKGDEIVTDITAFEACLLAHHPESILAVISTTSCFSPRAPDDVVSIATLCNSHQLYHIINHAYGVQCKRYNHLINEAMGNGKVDIIVASTDKNYMVPVGGGIIMSPDKKVLDLVSTIYPGRATANVMIDMCMTLLSMGSLGYTQLLQQREQLFTYLQGELRTLSTHYPCKLLDTPSNPISLAISLVSFPDTLNLTNLGKHLFHRGITGVRVVDGKASKQIGNITFQPYGCHHNEYPYPYLNIACAIGMTKDEIDHLLQALHRLFSSIHKAT